MIDATRTRELPAFPTRLVDRPALMEILDSAADHKVVTVVGGPGWGKTTTVAAWAARRRVCWLRLGDEDVSVRRLTRELLRSLRLRFPGLPAELVTTTAHGGAFQVDAIATLVCGLLDLHLDEPLVLVIDEASALRPGSDSARLLEALCRNSSRLLRLVLLTRAAPPLRLGNGSVREISAAELAFTRPEIAALLGGERHEAEAEVIWRRTAGWPAAVARYVEAVNGGHVPGNQLLTDMAARVLTHEPESTQSLLHTIALLGSVSAELCTTLGHPDAGTLLPELARRGLLVTETGTPVTWTAPEPIRDLLAGRAGDGTDTGTAAAEIRRRAARFCERAGAHAEALRHLVAARLWDDVTQLLLRRDEQIIAAGEVGAVLAAMAQMAADDCHDPRLLPVWGYAKQQRGDWLGSLHCYDKAAGSETIQPALAWRMGQLHDLTGQPDLALELFRRTTFGETATVDEVRLLSLAVRWLRQTGQREQARALATRMVATAQRCGGRTAQAWSHRAQGLLAAYDGDRVASEMHYGQALERARDAGDEMLRCTVRAERAWFIAEEGDPEEALREIDEVLRLSRQIGMTSHEPFCLDIHARAAARLGRFDDALADVARSQEMRRGQGVSQDILYGLLVLGEVHFRRGEPWQAQAFLDEARLMAAERGYCLPVQVIVLATLARVRAADDIAAARTLAEEAVRLSVKASWGQVPALLAHGWVALLAGDRAVARTDATEARALAGRRRDRAGLADSLQLAAVSAGNGQEATGLLAEAIALWRMVGDPVGEASAVLTSARLMGLVQERTTIDAEAELIEHGVRYDSRTAGVLGASLPRRPRLAVHTLGVFQVLRDGVPVPVREWQSKKARDLLKILIAHRGRPVARPRLAELLWPDVNSDRIGNRLSVQLSTLRAVLTVDHGATDIEPVVADRDAVSLDLSLVDVDMERFLAAAEAARSAYRHGSPTGLALLIDAVEMYHGEFLVEELYEDWASQPREEARSAYAALLRVLVRAVSDVDQRVDYLLRLLDLDRYDEGAHLELVRTLREARRYGEAQRRYELYAEQMAEIDVDPVRAATLG
jgi:ATP/maltotriose-dependent transcriptional regulator MalT/DNA-binding SARP family transcriptional activator